MMKLTKLGFELLSLLEPPNKLEVLEAYASIMINHASGVYLRKVTRVDQSVNGDRQIWYDTVKTFKS